MLSYDMNQRGQLPLYEHLYRCIKQDILSGAIACDERLPSKRRLAQHLGISLITVEGAYNQLLAEGYIYTQPRRGYYACKLTHDARNLQAGGKAQSAHAQAQANQNLASHAQSQAPVIADFSRSATRCQKLAADIWGKALRSALSQEPQDELFAVLDAQGSMRLRQAIASYLHDARGMNVDPTQIVIGAGAQSLYTYISLLFGTDAPIALENPGYPRLCNTYAALGHTTCPIDTDKEGANVFQLERTRAQLAHVMPSHQFPTGHVMSISRRYELLGWAARRGERYIVEDDYDWEFRFAGMPIPSLQSIDVNDKVIYISTFSKSLNAALRVAFMVLPHSLTTRFRERLGFLSSTVSSLDQVALARLIESGDYEKHLNRYRKQCRRTRDELIDALESSTISNQLRISEKDSGLHFVLELDCATPQDQIAAKMREGGVIISPMNGYLISNHTPYPADGKARFVMQYEELDHDAITYAVELLEKVVAS